jgi:hypothetical protein
MASSGDEYMVLLEKKAVHDGLQYIEELVFENGAVYKGYLRDGLREGPGT